MLMIYRAIMINITIHTVYIKFIIWKFHAKEYTKKDKIGIYVAKGWSKKFNSFKY